MSSQDPTRLGRDVTHRLRLPGAPAPLRRAASVGRLGASATRFAAGVGRPVQVRRALVGQSPARVRSTGAAPVSPPPWWSMVTATGMNRATEADPAPIATTTPLRRSTDLPARGLPRAARKVPDADTWTPGGIVNSLVTQVARVRRFDDVVAAGPMVERTLATNRRNASASKTAAAAPWPDPPARTAPPPAPVRRASAPSSGPGGPPSDPPSSPSSPSSPGSPRGQAQVQAQSASQGGRQGSTPAGAGAAASAAGGRTVRRAPLEPGDDPDRAGAASSPASRPGDAVPDRGVVRRAPEPAGLAPGASETGAPAAPVSDAAGPPVRVDAATAGGIAAGAPAWSPVPRTTRLQQLLDRPPAALTVRRSFARPARAEATRAGARRWSWQGAAAHAGPLTFASAGGGLRSASGSEEPSALRRMLSAADQLTPATDTRSVPGRLPSGMPGVLPRAGHPGVEPPARRTADQAGRQTAQATAQSTTRPTTRPTTPPVRPGALRRSAAASDEQQSSAGTSAQPDGGNDTSSTSAATATSTSASPATPGAGTTPLPAVVRRSLRPVAPAAPAAPLTGPASTPATPPQSSTSGAEAPTTTAAPATTAAPSPTAPSSPSA
ncbi:MAG TPA: hypothetical protein VFM50_11360, partial [Nocardioidaceae bacterium]|nr:hypothetical protein [Nocardioidaceae bacterium]